MAHLSPPAPFPDFDFAFDPALFPVPPPLPSSADLFSPAEALDLQVFLDNFGGFDWDQPIHYDHPIPPYSNPHLNTAPDPSASFRRSPALSHASIHTQRHVHLDTTSTDSTPSDPSSPTDDDKNSRGRSNKSLLSTPQKRLNHIMSEQKRRNAIRDGYAQLIALIAPAGSKHGIGMPTRGRPKGSGVRGKGQTKGKSGVLFRAVEYCQWLEQGRDALRAEILRLETAAGIQHP